MSGKISAIRPSEEGFYDSPWVCRRGTGDGEGGGRSRFELMLHVGTPIQRPVDDVMDKFTSRSMWLST